MLEEEDSQNASRKCRKWFYIVSDPISDIFGLLDLPNQSLSEST